MSYELGPVEFKAGERVLIYGIGNIGRQDDGLGIRMIEKLEMEIESSILDCLLTFESNYQLGIEDALLLADFDVVLFVDAAREANPITPFSIRTLKASAEFAFTTHAMSFSSVLTLCEELYAHKPRAFLIAIPGYEWDIAENLSCQGMKNLNCTFDSLTDMLVEVECMNSH
jgi:hydrogenase maturation protease